MKLESKQAQVFAWAHDRTESERTTTACAADLGISMACASRWLKQFRQGDDGTTEGPKADAAVDAVEVDDDDSEPSVTIGAAYLRALEALLDQVEEVARLRRILAAKEEQ